MARADSRLTLAALVARAVIMIAVATGPAQAERLPFSQAVIDAAMNEPDLRYAPSEACPGPAYSSLKQIGTSHCVLKPAQAFYFLALTAYLDHPLHPSYPGMRSHRAHARSPALIERPIGNTDARINGHIRVGDKEDRRHQ